jgi:hypothetical protein
MTCSSLNMKSASKMVKLGLMAMPMQYRSLQYCRVRLSRREEQQGEPESPSGPVRLQLNCLCFAAVRLGYFDLRREPEKRLRD